LQLVNLAVSGETSTSMLNNGQYSNALAFLRAHQNQVALITIDIGGNDVVGCGSPGASPQCFQQSEATMEQNITTILAGLHAAAPNAPIYGMTYYDPFLGDWLAGGAAQTQALATIPEDVALNNALTSLYGASNTADVQGAFAVTDSTTLVPSQWGTAPVDVVDACQWLDIVCTAGQPEGFGDDPNAAGQVQIALAFEHIVSLRPVSASGYWLAAADGGVFSFGNAPYEGSMGGIPLNSPVVGMAAAPDGNGYLMVASDGGIFGFGDAAFFGSMGTHTLNKPVVGINETPDGKGYWLVASDGGVFAFGDAAFYGSMGGTPLNQPIVGITATPDGKGYWLVASDGGIFAFGDAAFYGSMGGSHLSNTVVGIAATPSGRGYWLVASDGGIFAFGDAAFYGSMGGQPLNKPLVGIARTADGNGYWMTASDGGIFAFGDAGFYGPTGSHLINKPIVGIVST
jgi:ribosomal protein L24E